jgi:glucose-1-phosphatase
MIRAVVFDLGRVLVDFDHLIAARRIAQYSHRSPEEICGLFFASPVTAKFEAGLVTPEEFFAEVKRMLGISIPFEEFVPIWNEIFFISERNRQVQSLAAALSRKYRTLMLSNVNVLHWEYIREHYPVFAPFHKLILSYEVNAVKPDPEIYRIAVKEAGCAPEEIFYTDDRPDLIAQASSLGVRSFVFTEYPLLERDLRAAGVSW